MTRDVSLERLANYLHLLAESFDSISAFCQKVDVNRQQFNKYLAARHRPSQKVLAKIARYFHMEPDDLFREPDQFRRFYDGRDTELPDLQKHPSLLGLVAAARANQGEMARYCGLYWRFHPSSIYRGRILRSVTSIFERDDTVQYVTVERFPNLEGVPGTAFSFTYRGFCVLLGDRIFMIDFEGKQKNELTFTVLTPQHRSPVRFLYGLLTGVASTSYRQPFSARVVLAREGRDVISRRHLRASTVLPLDSPEIPAEVRAYLSASGTELLLGGVG